MQWEAYARTLSSGTISDDNFVQRDDRNKGEDESKVAGVFIGVPVGSPTVVPRLYTVESSGIVHQLDYECGLGEPLSLNIIKNWAELAARAGEGQTDPPSQVLEIPVFDEVSIDSLALCFDLNRAQITRCNGMSGQQILTSSILVPLAGSVHAGRSCSSSRQTGRVSVTGSEKTLKQQQISQLSRKVGCNPCAAHFYLNECGTYEDAVAQYKADKEWGEQNGTAVMGIPVGEVEKTGSESCSCAVS